jgi:hypothetical protein
MDGTWPQHQIMWMNKIWFFSGVGQLLETGKNRHRLSWRFLGFFLTTVFKTILKPGYGLFISPQFLKIWKKSNTRPQNRSFLTGSFMKPILPVPYQFITGYGRFSELSEI